MSIMKINSTVDGERLDKFLANNTGFSRSYLQRLISDDRIKINGMFVKPSHRISYGDEIIIDPPPARKLEAKPEDIPLDIVYEDDYILVVNKPKNMVVHPAPGNYTGTLVNALLYSCKDLSTINGVLRPGIVHRLDKDTSGLLVVAKDDYTHRKLAEQFKKHVVKKTYLALADGIIKNDEDIIITNIGRNPRNRKKMAVVENGREAITKYKVIERLAGRFTFLKVGIETGRTHQIRVHMSYIGHPIIGDTLYGKGENEFGVSGQLLHAYLLNFVHPATGKRVSFTAPLPVYFSDTLKRLNSKKLGTFVK